MTKIILASKSEVRKNLLRKAGIEFDMVRANINEREIKEENKPGDTAIKLALAKACEVSIRYKNNLIIGCDQILEFDQQILHKVTSLTEARQRLIAFRGKEHFLYSAAVLVKNNSQKWKIVKKSRLKMHNLTNTEIDEYLKKTGTSIINSVACYEIENIGITLFEEINGSIYDIMGLPLFELVNILRLYR